MTLFICLLRMNRLILGALRNVRRTPYAEAMAPSVLLSVTLYPRLNWRIFVKITADFSYKLSSRLCFVHIGPATVVVYLGA